MDRLWYKQLGFYSNPFSIKPAAFHNEVIGYNLELVFDKLEEGTIQFIKGPLGTGKTTILKHILNRFGGKKKVMYYCYGPYEKINTKNLLNGRYGIWGKMLDMMPRDMILLVDESDNMKKKDAEDILRYFREGYLKSVVFFGFDFKKSGFPKEMDKFIKKNTVSLKILNGSDAVELIRKRIGSIGMLPDNIIKQLYALSDNNMRLLLENCEDLCRAAVLNGDDKVTEKQLKELMPQKKKKTPKPKKVKKEKKPKKQEPKITIKEVNYNSDINLSNIRTYEEEMATARPEIEREE
ncbi:MAG: hypothetical protein GY861_09150 [bacterium]|nr:hypothetical protein [bacterium]